MINKIIGNPIGTTLPKPDFKQNDPSKGDYIKNKPEVTDVTVGQLLAIKDIDSDGHITKFEGVSGYTADEIDTKFNTMVGDDTVENQIRDAISTKADTSALTGHINDDEAHVSGTERTNWNAAKNHADSDHAPSDAQANVIEAINVNGTAQTITNKTVNIAVPTDYISTSVKGAANGVATLDDNGRVPSTQLPSYVDDVLEYDDTSKFPATGESGKIYIALDTNQTYRWSGSTYVVISETLALGETASTAYPGDKGAALAVLVGDDSVKNQIEKAVKDIQGGTVANATHAAEADTATNAINAEKAAHATNAEHATSADTAANATNASHAVTADKATTADSAATASSAETAGYATNAGSADTAISATTAVQDGDGNVITETYATQASVTSLSTLVDDLVGDTAVSVQISDALQAAFTEATEAEIKALFA